MIFDINLLIKIFSILFSFIYLLYSIVIYQQARLLNRVLKTEIKPFVMLICLVQIFLGIFLIIFSFNL
jgi:heme A synthase